MMTHSICVCVFVCPSAQSNFCYGSTHSTFMFINSDDKLIRIISALIGQLRTFKNNRGEFRNGGPFGTSGFYWLCLKFTAVQTGLLGSLAYKVHYNWSRKHELLETCGHFLLCVCPVFSFPLFINFLLVLSSIALVWKSPGWICTWMSVWCLITTSDALPLRKRGETHDTKQISQIKLWQNGSGHALVFLRRHCFDGKGPFMLCSLEESGSDCAAECEREKAQEFNNIHT